MRSRGWRERATEVPLQWRIGSFVVLGLLVIFALFGALGRAIAEDSKQRTLDEWASIARSTASVIDSEVELEFAQLEEVAGVLGGASPDPAMQRMILGTALGPLDPLAGHTVLFGPDGSVAWPAALAPEITIAATDPAVLEPLRTKRRYASGVEVGPAGPAVILAVPVLSGGTATGVLALVWSPEHGVINDLVASAKGLARSGHAELIDQHDMVIVSTEAGRTADLSEHPDFYGPPLALHTAAVGMTEPIGAQDLSEEGQVHDMAFVPLENAPWGLGLGGSDAELSADAGRWQTATTGLAGVSLLFALVLVLITTRSVARPVLALAAASRQIAAGDLETPIPPGGEGEIRALAQAFDHMRQKLRSALSELAVEKSRYEGIVTSMADAVITTDVDGRISAFNPAAEALTGWPAAEAVGHASGEILGMAGVSAPEGVERSTVHRRDGTTVRAATTHSPISGREGASAGSVYVLRDVSREEALERMKEEFLATVSHELRTPLGFIMGYATSLLLPDAPDDRATTRRFLRVIADSSKELEGLVDDLLDMTKIGSGTLTVDPRPTALGALIRSAVERARGRGTPHRLSCVVPASLPAALVDPRRFEQVLHDLLDNAIKYSPDGGAIGVSARENAGEIVVSVVDEGFGMRPDELTAVFERFRRGRAARAKGITGTGLGLSICRGIVEAHGGRIWAESPPSDARAGDLRGSALRFTVPVAPAAAARADPDAMPVGGRA